MCNNDHGVKIGQVTFSSLYPAGTYIRYLLGNAGVTGNKRNYGKISILGS